MYITVKPVLELRMTCSNEELAAVKTVIGQLRGEGVDIQTERIEPKPISAGKVDLTKTLTVAHAAVGEKQRTTSLSTLLKIVKEAARIQP